MTGPGTNTYLLGQREVAVLDPGPVIPRHTEAILSQAGGRIRWILATHTHPDHSPGTRALLEATGAEVLGRPPPPEGPQDRGFEPDRILDHDDLFETKEFTLKAIHTPGHASNHLCYLMPEEKVLFTGDHIMQGSTVVIAPPDGDMADYLRSLALLKEYDLAFIAPGHGDIMESPYAVVDWIIQHRYEREAKVSASLEDMGRGNLDELVAVVYADVDRGLHEVAKRSLEAHLIKLVNEDKAACDGDKWIWVG